MVLLFFFLFTPLLETALTSSHGPAIYISVSTRPDQTSDCATMSGGAGSKSVPVVVEAHNVEIVQPPKEFLKYVVLLNVVQKCEVIC
jgi:hypothetical protein